MRIRRHGTIANPARNLLKYPDTTILIEGTTDNQGTEQHNQTLLERRAQDVANYNKGRCDRDR
jgi:outer membrane protein OmpA-like peptidoglycan-associated protein